MGVTMRAGRRRGVFAGTAAAVAAVAVSSLALSACSRSASNDPGASGATAATGAAVAAPTATAVVQAAMLKAVDRRTVSVQVSLAGSPSAVATGAVSLASPLRARLDVSAAGLGPAEVMVDHGTVYLKFAALAALAGGKPWLSASVTELRSIAASLPGATGQRLAAAGGLSGLSGADLLTTLASVPSAVRVGSDTTDGVATTHYRATERLADLAARAAAAGHQLPEQLRARLASGGAVTVDTWVDSTGLPRRVSVAVSGGLATDSRVPRSVDIRFADFGASVGAPPPADQVGDLAAVLGRYGQFLGGVSG